jgi:hypothetical protein
MRTIEGRTHASKVNLLYRPVPVLNCFAQSLSLRVRAYDDVDGCAKPVRPDSIVTSAIVLQLRLEVAGAISKATTCVAGFVGGGAFGRRRNEVWPGGRVCDGGEGGGGADCWEGTRAKGSSGGA